MRYAGFRKSSGAVALAVVILVAGKLASAEDAKPAETSMKAFERLVGGNWHIEGGKPLNAYNRFEWGVGGKSLKFKSFVIGKEADVLRAEGYFAWDPVKKAHVTHVVSGDGALYDGEWSMDAGIWTMNFTHSSPAGLNRFKETWVFPDRDTYVWTLYHKSDAGEKQQIQATFRRQTAK